jgi:hypothetical protein
VRLWVQFPALGEKRQEDLRKAVFTLTRFPRPVTLLTIIILALG